MAAFLVLQGLPTALSPAATASHRKSCPEYLTKASPATLVWGAQPVHDCPGAQDCRYGV